MCLKERIIKFIFNDFDYTYEQIPAVCYYLWAVYIKYIYKIKHRAVYKYVKPVKTR